MGVSYAMGDITLAYEMGSMDDENESEEIENHTNGSIICRVRYHSYLDLI